MKMWSYALLCVACAIGFGYAQVPQHCYSPPHLTFTSVSFNHRLSEFRYFIGQYDAHNERYAFQGDTRHGKNSSAQWFIMLYKEKTVYEIDLDSKTCNKLPFKRFYHLGVPENAKFEGAYELGGPGESVEVDSWYEPHFFGGKNWVGVFTRKHCYPVSTFLLQNHRNETITDKYSNVVEGLVNPDWFIPPSICKD